MDLSNVSRPLPLCSVKVDDVFWKSKMDLIRTCVIPYQWNALNDRIADASPSYCIRNFKLAAEKTRQRLEQKSKFPDIAFSEVVYPTNKFETLPKNKDTQEDCAYGYLFQDSDLYKWIEATAYSLAHHRDSELEQTVDSAVDLICSAQQPSGYINTFYTLNNPSGEFTNLRNNHELYCLGHLIEAAAAYFESTGKQKLLKAAEKFADYAAERFGPGEEQLKGYPGHEIAEMALIRLYQITGSEKYLKLSTFFIDQRGTKPHYFDRESGENNEASGFACYRYQQAHLPVRDQEDAVGHAVRAVYLYSGMADAARLTKDSRLYESCVKLWNDITGRKMYITGGIGGTNCGEAFSYAYDLPNDAAYAETCASIGLVFFARRMIQIDTDSRYADVMERALYNGILSGMAEDGKSFFYANPLAVHPDACGKDDRLWHVRPVRQKWFGCACCPPNLARLINSLPLYGFTETADTLFIHLFFGSELEKDVDGRTVRFKIESQLPWKGQVRITVSAAEKTSCTLAVRIPEWAEEFSVPIKYEGAVIKKGYLYMTKEWHDEEVIDLLFPMKAKRVRANLLVRENTGRTAVVRGPVVYCLEQADNGKNIHLLSLPKNTPLIEEAAEDVFPKIPRIYAEGRRALLSADRGALYTAEEPVFETALLTWVPYFTWANRGEGEMQVWTAEI